MLLFLNVIDDEILQSKLEVTYHLYKKDLMYVANNILNDYHEAEDVVQSAFIKFADYVDEEIDVKCHKTKALIVIIVRSLSINIYKQRKRRNTASFDDLEEVLQDEVMISPEVNILRLDKTHEMAKILSKINPSYADILTLKYTYEYTNSEIAGMLSIIEVNVRKRLSRAKKALKKIIEGGEIYEWA
jgi:RNA polymerase sigma-70 factor (ECF subfamily)